MGGGGNLGNLGKLGNLRSFGYRFLHKEEDHLSMCSNKLSMRAFSLTKSPLCQRGDLGRNVGSLHKEEDHLTMVLLFVELGGVEPPSKQSA